MPFKFFLRYIVAVSVFVTLLPGCIFLPHTSEVAQAIRGQVFDEETGEPVCGARIYYTVSTEEKSYTESAISDKNGCFLVNAPRQWHYIIYMGSPGVYPDPDNRDILKRKVTIQKEGYQTGSSTYIKWLSSQTELNGSSENLFHDPLPLALEEGESDLGSIFLIPDEKK